MILKKKLPDEDLKITSFTVRIPNHIIRDFELMEKQTKQTVDALVTKALLMFIATHNDYLGKRRQDGSMS